MCQKLVISNIAWNWEKTDENEMILNTIQAVYNIKNIELAPTKIWGTDWTKIRYLGDAEISAVGLELKERGFRVPSFQAVLFNCPDCQLNGSKKQQEDFIDHMKFILNLCQKISNASGVTRPCAIVVGAPKNRLSLNQPTSQCFDNAQRIFKELGKYATTCNAVLCLEANPKDYGCDFIFNAEQAGQLVRAVDNPGFKLHIDLACMYLAGDKIEEIVTKNADIIYHIHISEPFLGDFANPAAPHKEFAAILGSHLAHHDVLLSIEMKDGDNNLERVTKALDFTTSTYFGHF